VTDNSWLNYPAATPATVSYTANALNQYTAVGAVTPGYDGNGNLTFDGTLTFGYDAENRLTSAVGAGNSAAYTYDAQGRRKTRTVNGATTVFVTDAGNREVLEYDGTSGAIQRWYAYGLGSNEVLNQINVAAATRATLVPDIQGSVIASLDSASGALSKIGYLPYGNSAGATPPFGYTGQRIDPETGGLYYYRARHYSPAWGRFLQPDPIGYAGGVNRYAYVGNDPLNATDPHGQWTLQLGITFSGGYGLLAGSFGFGVVADLTGNIGAYASLAGAGGAGAYIKAGVSGALSSADTIYDLGSNNTSGLNLAGLPQSLSQVSNFTAGMGVGGSLDLSVGKTGSGSEYGSWGATVGAVAGAGASTGYQYTYVAPIYQATPPPPSSK
jgi:RHS repeat-associated protein